MYLEYTSNSLKMVSKDHKSNIKLNKQAGDRTGNLSEEWSCGKLFYLVNTQGNAHVCLIRVTYHLMATELSEEHCPL